MFRTASLLRGLRLLKPFIKPKALALSAPFLLYGLCNFDQCSFLGFGSKLSKNKLQDRVTIAEYPANFPIEDRFLTYQLTNADGYVVAVFDGHGGWQMSDFAMKNMAQAIDRALLNNKTKYAGNEEQLVVNSLKDAFTDVENSFLKIAKEAYALGFPRIGRVGSCALVIVVVNDKLYAANAGDSQGLVFQEKGDELEFHKLNKKLNANSKKEQARLKGLFPTQTDIVECKNNNPKSCYVKGRLQPTRALGDFRLKFAEFNNPSDLGKQYGFQGKLKVFTGPYITHQPEIRVINLTKNHKCAVIACDGLWDQLSKQQVTDVAKKHLASVDKLSQSLLDTALDRAATNNTLGLSELKKIPQGQKRRKLHDDITILTINLEKQTS